MFNNVRLLAMDFDGVVVPEAKMWTAEGMYGKTASGLDGYGISTLVDRIPVVVISTEDSPITKAWCDAHEVTYRICNRSTGKDVVVSNIATTLGIKLKDVVYIGNDWTDMCAMNIVGHPVAVADAHPLLRTGSYYITTEGGGHGAIREVCDLILASNSDYCPLMLRCHCTPKVVVGDTTPIPTTSPCEGCEVMSAIGTNHTRMGWK